MAPSAQAPLTLYTHPFSNNAQRCELALELMGIPYTAIVVDLLKGEHREPEFLAKNDRGQVPVLEHGDARLAESVAILLYLEMTVPKTRALLPESAQAKALALTRLQQFAAKLEASNYYLPIWFPTSDETRVGAAKRNEALKTALAPKLAARATEWAAWDDALKGRAYLAGGDMSLADVAILHTAILDAEHGFDFAGRGLPRLDAWYKRMIGHPAVRAHKDAYCAAVVDATGPFPTVF